MRSQLQANATVLWDWMCLLQGKHVKSQIQTPVWVARARVQNGVGLHRESFSPAGETWAQGKS